jgi:hypothetical protein
MIPRKTALDAARILNSEIRLMLITAATQSDEEGRRDAFRSIRDRLRNACQAHARLGIDHDHEDIYLCVFDSCNHLSSALSFPIFDTRARHVAKALDRLRDLRAILEAPAADAAAIGGAV